VSIRELVRNTLRMRPDRIVVGECRGGEALDMLQAMNTGHDGSLTTIHANSPRDALARLETLVLMAGVELPARAIREQIASGINIVVQTARLPDGSRKITAITEVTGLGENSVFMTQDVFVYKQQGVDAAGRIIGQYRPTGTVPRIVEQLRARGIKVAMEVFAAA
jgi:pilus assembly protein CpaF